MSELDTEKDVVIEVIRGEEGLEYSHQEEFPETPKCSCGGDGRIAFVVYEPMVGGFNISYVRDDHDNEPGSMWVHDAVAVAIYFCKKCSEPIALYNQC